jgi:hypothetical protein
VPDDPALDAMLADFADHLVPEAFATPTLAHRVALEPVELTGLADDGDALLWFDRWVEARIVDALEGSWPHDPPLTVVYVSDGHLLRRYEECGCGYLDCATNPARDEVAALATPWVFAAHLPRPRPTWQVVTNEHGAELDEVLVASAEIRWTVVWYAEARRSRGVADPRRAGVARR